MEIRHLLDEHNAKIRIIAKIENQEGIDNIDEILTVADGIMVARGDMGVEIDFAEIPAIQKHLIERAMLSGKICITATQMLDSMMVNPRPTRAEITDVANAIYDGTGAVMLSGETAAGKYPVAALKAMSMIAETTESDSSFESLAHHVSFDAAHLTLSAAVSHAACTTATDIGASAIITASKSGETARLLSRFRPEAQIIACVLDETTCRQLNIYRGVTPLMMDYANSTDELISMSVDVAEKAGLIHSGDRVVVTAGVPVGVSGTTNMIKVHMVGDALLAGVGIGTSNAKGEVCVCRNAEEAAKKFKPGQILVVPFTTNDALPFMKEAAGIITEEAGMNSHSAIVGLTLGKAVIVGATNATRTLKDGMMISMDCARGLVQAMMEYGGMPCGTHCKLLCGPHHAGARDVPVPPGRGHHDLGYPHEKAQSGRLSLPCVCPHHRAPVCHPRPQQPLRGACDLCGTDGMSDRFLPADAGADRRRSAGSGAGMLRLDGGVRRSYPGCFRPRMRQLSDDGPHRRPGRMPGHAAGSGRSRWLPPAVPRLMCR